MQQAAKYLFNQPYLLLILTTMFWGGNFITSRLIAADFGGIPLAFIRWALAIAFLTPFALKYVKKDFKTIVKHWKIMTLLSFSGIAVFNTFVYIGLKDTTAINGLLIQSFGPLIVILWSFILFQEKIRFGQIAAITISFLGVCYIIFRGDIENVLSLTFNFGDMIIIVAIAFYALYSALLRKKPDIHWMSLLYMTFVIGEIIIAPFFVYDLWQNGNHMFFNQTSILVLLYVSTFPAIFAYIFFNRAVALVGANVAASFFHLIPVFGTIMAIMFIGESLEIFHVIGFILVMIGVFLGSKAGTKK